MSRMPLVLGRVAQEPYPYWGRLLGGPRPKISLKVPLARLFSDHWTATRRVIISIVHTMGGTMTESELKAAFIKAFASVPQPLRSEIVAVVELQPYTWASAFLEVENGTKVGDAILKELRKIKVI